MLYRQPQLAEIAAELFDTLVVSLDGVRSELRQLICDTLRFRYLAWSIINI